MGKGLDQGGPISAIAPASVLGHPAKGGIWLTVNGELRQRGDLAQMTWKVAEVVARLSKFVKLAPGDLIFTDTPAGVSTVVRGDVLEGGRLDAFDIPRMEVFVAAQAEEVAVALADALHPGVRQVVARTEQSGRGAVLEAAVAVADGADQEGVVRHRRRGVPGRRHAGR